MQLTAHEKIANEIAEAEDRSTLKVARCSLRQGDVVMLRQGDADPNKKVRKTPQGGIQIAAGAHGEHRLIADEYYDAGPGLVGIASQGLLVHTDVPKARHASIVLEPGCWKIQKLQELGVDDMVQEVRD